MVMIDTDVFVDYLKKNKEAVDFINKSQPIYISFITALEILAGARDKVELNKIHRNFKNFQILFSNKIISIKSIEIFKKYYLINNLDIPDSIIASTAIYNNLSFFSRNKKHYEIIKELKYYLPY